MLVCIIPQRILRNLAPILVNRFYDLTVERFDDDEYEALSRLLSRYRKPLVPLLARDERCNCCLDRCGSSVTARKPENILCAGGVMPAPSWPR